MKVAKTNDIHFNESKVAKISYYIDILAESDSTNRSLQCICHCRGALRRRLLMIIPLVISFIDNKGSNYY